MCHDSGAAFNSNIQLATNKEQGSEDENTLLQKVIIIHNYNVIIDHCYNYSVTPNKFNYSTEKFMTYVQQRWHNLASTYTLWLWWLNIALAGLGMHE